MVKYNFTNKRVAILGFGEEGYFTALFLLQQGATITILDEKPIDSSKNNLIERLKRKSVKFHFNRKAFRNLTFYDYIVRSPVISRLRPELVGAEKMGVKVVSQTQIFLSECPCVVVGVTGTKGKGTVSTLIYQFLKNSDPQNAKSKNSLLKSNSQVYLTGNIGGKDAPLAILPKLKREDIVIFELSSFQLEDLTVSPNISIMLQIFPDHLDRHKSMKEYISAKHNITKFQKADDLLIINIDSPATKKIFEISKSKKIAISQNESLSQLSISEDKIFFTRDDKKKIELVDLKNTNLLGKHNQINIGISAITAYLLGANTKSFNSILKNFKGLPHRLQYVGSVKGIKFYDDSIATIPDATQAAINSFQSPIILIIGGLVKNLSYVNLAKAIKNNSNIKSIILFGRGQGKILQDLKDADLKINIYNAGKSMAKIFDKINDIAEPGDSVLFSPGAASFDMYQNYKKRGEDFTAYVKTINK